MKECCRCHEVKTLERYQKNPRAADGLSYHCNDCRNAARRATASENGEQTRARERAYYAKNHARIKATPHYSSEDRRSKSRARAAAWRRANPQAVADQIGRRRARKVGAGVFVITDRDLQRIYSSPCFICGRSDSVAADHIIPIARGGRHSIGNLMPLCPSHNSQKATRLLIEWRRLLGIRFTADSAGTAALARLKETR
jgi:5-methylcytosine-specific restriction endonuclease McrA